MKKLTEYIVEKFKISNDIENENIMMDNYKVGTTCLCLYQNWPNNSSSPSNYFEIAKITKINRKSIKLESLTKFDEKDIITFKADDRQNSNWKFILQTISDSTTCILIPDEKIKPIIEFLKHNQELSFFALLNEGKITASGGDTVYRKYPKQMNFPRRRLVKEDFDLIDSIIDKL